MESEENHVCECVPLGGFNCPINVPYLPTLLYFLNSAFKYAPPREFWPPFLSAKHKADLAQADYSLDDISTLAANWAALCSRCLQWGHRKVSFQTRLICINCSVPDHKVIDCTKCATPASLSGAKSISTKRINSPDSLHTDWVTD